MADAPTPIVFFDGVCGLCNRFVDWLLRVDRKGVLRFAPLQGETAKSHAGDLAVYGDTVVFLEGTRAYHRSEAVIRILCRLGGVWALARLARVIPRRLRDAAYDAVARNRYRLFGRRESCRLPSLREQQVFLP